MNVHSIARLDELAPIVQNMLHTADALLTADGICLEIVQGGRSWNMQQALYDQGRESLQSVNTARAAVGLAPITDEQNARPVTWAKPGESWHNFYCAADCVPFINGVPIWDVAHPHFGRMVQAMRNAGFVCGIDWPGQKKDSDHFQWSGKFPVTPTPEIVQIFKDGGVQAVWAEAAA